MTFGIFYDNDGIYHDEEKTYTVDDSKHSVAHSLTRSVTKP